MSNPDPHDLIPVPRWALNFAWIHLNFYALNRPTMREPVDNARNAIEAALMLHAHKARGGVPYFEGDRKFGNYLEND